MYHWSCGILHETLFVAEVTVCVARLGGIVSNGTFSLVLTVQCIFWYFGYSSCYPPVVPLRQLRVLQLPSVYQVCSRKKEAVLTSGLSDFLSSTPPPQIFFLPNKETKQTTTDIQWSNSKIVQELSLPFAIESIASVETAPPCNQFGEKKVTTRTMSDKATDPAVVSPIPTRRCFFIINMLYSGTHARNEIKHKSPL